MADMRPPYPSNPNPAPAPGRFDVEPPDEQARDLVKPTAPAPTWGTHAPAAPAGSGGEQPLTAREEYLQNLICAIAFDLERERGTLARRYRKEEAKVEAAFKKWEAEVERLKADLANCADVGRRLEARLATQVAELENQLYAATFKERARCLGLLMRYMRLHVQGEPEELLELLQALAAPPGSLAETGLMNLAARRGKL